MFYFVPAILCRVDLALVKYSHHVIFLMFQLIPVQATLRNPLNSSLASRFGLSSSASSEPASNDVKACEEEKVTDQSEQAKAADQTEESGFVSKSRS